MPRFRVNRAYRTQTLGPWVEGSEVDLTDEQAAWLENDSPGVLTPLADEDEAAPKDDGEAKPAAKRTTKRSAKRDEPESGEAMHTGDGNGLT